MFKIHQFTCEHDWPNCGTDQNIVCRRGGNCDTASDCKLLIMDEKFRRALMDEHNEHRNEVAEGRILVGENGEAANMMAISYDTELEYTAICYVNQCGKAHDQCKRTKKYSAGQNAHVVKYKYEYDEMTHIMQAVHHWYDQVKNTSDAVFKSFSPGPYTSYTRMVWAETAQIGCARSHEGDTYYLVCNYGNEGNILGSPVYVKGTKCTKCPPGISCNAKYKGLCGEIDETYLIYAPRGFSNKAGLNLIMLVGFSVSVSLQRLLEFSFSEYALYKN
ncbi:hypothetical protein JTB14_009469 [Gonioctena quinquepunctata]|nr:hypothetical protein JTB14_009469 [Gonioctena quinquepunctata]